jgi:CMP-N-acetylneuraminic acid synthetase
LSTSDNICLIPAKAASTRLKKKNILKINGKELIYYPIKAALESGLFNDDIFVSTESEEIEKIALKHGARVHIREDKLAHDPYGVEDVTLDFLDRNAGFREYSNIFVLLPTAPMILAEDIIKAYEIFRHGKFKYLMSVSETIHNALRSVFIRNHHIEPLFQDKILNKSQDLEKTYHVNGAITIMDIKDFLKTKTYYTYPVGSYIMPPERSIDIDTEFDYKMAQLLIGN